MSNEEDMSLITEVSSEEDQEEEDFDNVPFECPKCGYEHQTYIDSEYSSCVKCIRLCCKACRTTCDKCNSMHCWRCSNYFENCCKTLCGDCSWFCNIHEDYHCKCLLTNQCMECEEISCQDFIYKRKNGNIYCEECNFNYCENCDERTEDNILCYSCTDKINIYFYRKLPRELRSEIIQFLNF
jgi:hypothetical protein